MIKNREVALKILQVGKAGFSTQEDGFKKLDECIELIDKHVAEQLILSGVVKSLNDKEVKIEIENKNAKDYWNWMGTPID